VELFPGGSTAATEVMKLDDASTGHITSMAYDKQNGALYYVLNSEHRVSEIWMADVKEGVRSPKPMLRGHGIKHIAVDWVGGNLYYASDGGFLLFPLCSWVYQYLIHSGIGIGVCSTDGKYCHHLVSVPQHKTGEFAQHYSDLIAYPKRGLLFWLEVDSAHPNGVVKVVGMDGKRVSHIILLTSLLISFAYLLPGAQCWRSHLFDFAIGLIGLRAGEALHGRE
jgi:hypothetical protein